ncbi:MAG: glutamine amidotransferase-related protein, partial [Peptoniphilus senegalensis]
MILVVDFGGQYNQLIARRIRDLNIYCEVVPYNKTLKELENRDNVEGIIFTGGP